MREITYQEAIKEALTQVMEADDRVILMGQGTDSPWSFGDTSLGLIDRFGRKRVYDIPISENGLTGVAAGAAIAGMRPIIMHPRVDFMFYAIDSIANHAANWHYMFGGGFSVPFVVRGCVNRGNEQAAQHSQSPHAMYAHIPGLKVVMPASPMDAKGLMVAAVRDPNPVIYIDDRWLYGLRGDVPEDIFETPIGKATIARKGSDITIVAVSYTVPRALKASEALSAKGISAEVVDVRTLKPLDEDTIVGSVRKTGRLLVVDSGWLSFGASGEIVARVAEKAFNHLKASPARLATPDIPAPASITLEKAFFVDEGKIVDAAMRIIG